MLLTVSKVRIDGTSSVVYQLQIDEPDYERIKGYNITITGSDGNDYPAITFNGRSVPLHKFLVDPDNTCLVDHKDGNRFNLSRLNLRLCDHQQNARNRRKRKGTTSKYKGVHYYKITDRWVSIITVDGRRIHLGYFHTEEEAAKAYNKAALHYFGEFAVLNPV